MSTPFGPWATMIDTGANPQLSAFWRRRLTMLVPVSRASSVLSRRNLACLLAAGALLAVLPTVRTTTAAADEPKPADSAKQFSASAGEKGIEEWKRETWRLVLHIDSESLDPPVVQFAVLDKDPLADFRAAVKKGLSFYRKQLERAENESQKTLQRTVGMSHSWDSVFRHVTGVEVYLLTSSGYHEFSSNTPDGKRWFVTKCETSGGKPVCWCVPLEVTKGKEFEVTLAKGNMFNLDAAFDDSVREAEEAK
jgi:hypothetical protein